MSFINWFKSQPEENSESSQLNLLEPSQPMRRRADGAAIRKDFTQTIQEKGGDGRTQAYATEQMTRTLFGCGTEIARIAEEGLALKMP